VAAPFSGISCLVSALQMIFIMLSKITIESFSACGFLSESAERIEMNVGSCLGLSRIRSGFVADLELTPQDARRRASVPGRVQGDPLTLHESGEDDCRRVGSSRHQFDVAYVESCAIDPERTSSFDLHPR
jgi:hypothetical protein